MRDRPLAQTLAPPGKHVVQLFVQYAPYSVDPKIGNWADPAFKVPLRAAGRLVPPAIASVRASLPQHSARAPQESFVKRVFSIVDEFCPGFSAVRARPPPSYCAHSQLSCLALS